MHLKSYLCLAPSLVHLDWITKWLRISIHQFHQTGVSYSAIRKSSRADGAHLALDFTKIVHHDTYPEIDSAKADLCGKIVCITGASKGIGRATALSFAKAGAEAIVIGARSDLTSLELEIASAAQVSGKKAPKVLRLELDVTDQVSVENAAKDIEKTLGRLDILINNAGYLSSFTPMIESDPMQWWTNWEVNIRGVYLVTRSLLPLMIKGGEKTIINLASIGALNLTPGASG